MTILTKPSNAKKGEKVPIVLGGGHDDVAMLHGGATLLSQQCPAYSPDSDAESMIFNRPPHVTCLKTALLFVISLIIMMMGILGGYTLYRLYAPLHGNMHYRALCDIPYELATNSSLPHIYERGDDFYLNWRTLWPQDPDNNFGDLMDENYFRQDVELDMSDDEGLAKIDVPDFKDGRRGRFMHDFKENQSAIIDTSSNRCFIMPLDRDTTLPPKSFMDLMQKMGNGYYNIDTDRVRRNMRVVTPPITDKTLISERIANECYDMNVYMLEKYVTGVFKRSIRAITDAGKFAEFSGKGIVEFDLVNIADVEAFEEQQKHKLSSIN